MQWKPQQCWSCFFLLFNSVEEKHKILWGTLIKGRIEGVGTDILMLLTAMNVNISPQLLSQNLDVSLCLEQWNRQYFMTKC